VIDTVDTTDSIPIFPLPGAVLYPETVLPLHVFEPRYRDLVRDVTAGDNRLALALLRPGYENEYTGAPPIHTVATIGRIENLRLHPDGRSNFDLVGVERVDLEEVPSEHSYRMARYVVRDETEVDAADADIKRARVELFAAHNMLMTEIADESGHPLSVDAVLPYATVVNGACANLPVDAEIRQQLLEIDDIQERQRRVADHVREALERILALKAETGQMDGPTN